MPDRYLEEFEATVDPATYALIARIAAEADDMGYRAYLVGGPVRDLLLGIPQSDIDLVFEGEAIPLGRRLAEALGGHAIVHERFGTVKWVLDDPHHPPSHPLTGAPGLPPFIDLITARGETYEHPAALPTVTFSDMRDDLFRRDFTVNTLALALNGPGRGQLLDLYGGLDDIRASRIRVLHDLSFVDDPTRIFRALRFDCRLPFQLDAHTRGLLSEAVPLVAELTPDRVRHEIMLVLDEACAPEILDKMAGVGLFPNVFPGVEWSALRGEQVARLKACGIREHAALLSPLLWDALPSTVDAVSARLALPHSWQDPLRALARLRQDAVLTRPSLRNSELYFRLRTKNPQAVEWLALLTDDLLLRSRLCLFLDDLRHRGLTVSGDDLRELGLRPGPHYRSLLDNVRAAVMDHDAPGEVDQRSLLVSLARDL